MTVIQESGDITSAVSMETASYDAVLRGDVLWKLWPTTACFHEI